MNRINQFLYKTSSLLQAALASISLVLMPPLPSSLYTIGTDFCETRASLAMVPIKDDKLNSPVADDDEGGVGDVDVGEPAVAVVDSVFDFMLGSAEVLEDPGLLDFFTLVMPLRLSAET